MTGHRVEEIRDGLFWVTNGQYQSLVLDTGEGAVVVDAPPSLAAVLPAVVADVTSGPVTHIVYSHAHGDHIGAAGVFAAHRPEVVASTRTAAALARHDDHALRLPPTTTFETGLTLHVGRQELRLSFRGANHSADNVFVHLPRQRTVMLVDVVVPGWVPFRSWTVASDVPGLLRAHDQLLEDVTEHGVDTIVGGHLDRLGTPGDVELDRAYLDDVLALSAAAMGSTSIASVVSQLTASRRREDGGPYRIADAWYDRVAQQVADRLVERWADRLGGVGVFAHSHAVTAIDALRFDYNLDGGAEPPAGRRGAGPR